MYLKWKWHIPATKNIGGIFLEEKFLYNYLSGKQSRRIFEAESEDCLGTSEGWEAIQSLYTRVLLDLTLFYFHFSQIKENCANSVVCKMHGVAGFLSYMHSDRRIACACK